MSASRVELDQACALLRSGRAIPDRNYLAAMLEAAEATIERQAQEIERLRQVVRAADFIVVAGQDSRYDEARAALVKFDVAAQKAR